MEPEQHKTSVGGALGFRLYRFYRYVHSCSLDAPYWFRTSRPIGLVHLILHWNFTYIPGISFAVWGYFWAVSIFLGI